MHPTPRLLLSLLCLGFVPVLAAKKAAEPADAPPQLISTHGGGPKWKSIPELIAFAAKGDAKACLELGDRSLEGDGVPRDVTKAAALYEQAAKAGAADGWFRLGKIYHDGLLDVPDYGKALDYFTTAAKAGVVEAQHNIGAMLVSARGVKRDYIEGLAWLIVAKQAGAPSDAETQVRARVSRRPADIAAAEARAADIVADLSNVVVHATLLNKLVPLVAPPAVKPVLAAPKPEQVAPPKVVVPLSPAPPVIPAGKP